MNDQVEMMHFNFSKEIYNVTKYIDNSKYEQRGKGKSINFLYVHPNFGQYCLGLFPAFKRSQ